jgi:hypothetical protein
VDRRASMEPEAELLRLFDPRLHPVVTPLIVEPYREEARLGPGLLGQPTGTDEMELIRGLIVVSQAFGGRAAAPMSPSRSRYSAGMATCEIQALADKQISNC